MSGIFTTLSDSQTGLFRLQQAKKDWERAQDAMSGKDAMQRLADKADQARQSFALTPQQQRDKTAAMTALEEAKRIGGPKAAAAQRLEDVERKIAELKLMMRHAQGDREKLAQLAREAAVLAREAGRAAKEYGGGIAAAAEMGESGGAGLDGVTTEHTTTRTSLTIVQTEVSVTVTISGDALAAAQGGAAPGTAANGAAIAAAVSADGAASAEAVSAEASSDTAADATETEASGLEGQAAGSAAATPQNGAVTPQTAFGSGASAGNAMMQRMIADNAAKMSRYKEADTFGRRVEAVLSQAKSIIGEAKAANELDSSEQRRKARRESFKEYDKILTEAQKSVNELRQAAFGSSIKPEDILDALANASGPEGGEGTGGTEHDGSGLGTSGLEATTGSEDATAPGAATLAMPSTLNLLA